MIAMCVFTCVGCDGRAGRAAGYLPGTPLSTIVAELGQPDEDKPISADFAATGLCPADTVRLVSYFGPRALAFLNGDPATILCVDRSNRVLKDVYSISLAATKLPTASARRTATPFTSGSWT
jgi:hypothetical protein